VKNKKVIVDPETSDRRTVSSGKTASGRGEPVFPGWSCGWQNREDGIKNRILFFNLS
jgi:hypothetical protein